VVSGSLEIVGVPARTDNYIWLVHDRTSGETLVIDPAETDGVLAAAEARGWTISQIWNTHWHFDHIDGNPGIVAATGANVAAPAAELAKIPNVDRPVREGDTLKLGDHVATVMEVPAHTAGHVAYHFGDEAIIFVGDTMFAMGCGRLFEGTAEQMYQNMRRFESLPDETRVYCAHEYTLSNGLFAQVAEPDNQAISDRVAQVKAARDRGEPTVPTTIALERATNPFLRAQSVEQLAERRAAKDRG
jgi:hydroxyacylglutathione hydrolase